MKIMSDNITFMNLLAAQKVHIFLFFISNLEWTDMTHFVCMFIKLTHPVRINFKEF